MRFSTLLALLPLAISQTYATLQRSFISADEAQTIITSAVANAQASNITDNIAVVDPAGHLVAFLRMDGSFLGSIDISQKKAKTSILFSGVYGGQQLYPVAQPGQSLYGVQETNGGLVLFGGGFPIWMDGQLIGGIGVSGGSEEQDVQVAKAGVQGLDGASHEPPSR